MLRATLLLLLVGAAGPSLREVGLAEEAAPEGPPLDVVVAIGVVVVVVVGEGGRCCGCCCGCFMIALEGVRWFPVLLLVVDRSRWAAVLDGVAVLARAGISSLVVSAVGLITAGSLRAGAEDDRCAIRCF